MDDTDDVQITRKKEVAREIINHPKIPETDLPPIKARKIVIPHVCDTCIYAGIDYGFVENGETKIYCKKLNYHVKKYRDGESTRNYCTFWDLKA